MVNIKKPKQYIKEKLRAGKNKPKQPEKVLLVCSLDQSIIEIRQKALRRWGCVERSRGIEQARKKETERGNAWTTACAGRGRGACVEVEEGIEG